MIRLTRSVSVQCFDAEATVAVGRDRPEFLAVARLAADLGRPIGARDVLRELLGQRPDVLGHRVIDRCVALGLLRRNGDQGDAALSPAGRLALERREVLVPEEGVWRFFLVDDPLVPSVLVHARRIETEPAHRQRDAAKQPRARGERLPQAEEAPELLRRCRRAQPAVSAQDGHLLQLIDLSDKGASGPPLEFQLLFSWDQAPLLRLSGQLPANGDGKKPKAIDAVLELPGVVGQLSYDALWKTLITRATGVSRAELDWWRDLSGTPLVPSPFEPLLPIARHAFARDIDVPAPTVPGLGTFAPTVLKSVPLVPATPTDAQAWLRWLQWESIDDHVTPPMLDQKARALLARFPHHQPRALGAPELLARADAERGDRAWFLLAPSDLGLWS